MSVLRTLTLILFAAGCAVEGPKDELADPSIVDGDDAADALSRRLDYRGAIGFGETVEGTYSETGYSGYAFVGRAGASVSLSLVGHGNDPMLYVYGPKRGDTWSHVRRIAMNDDFDGLDSRVELDLRADGTYLVLAREYWGDEGSFSLTLDCEGDECRAECAPECPAGAACDRIVCVRAPCPSYCAVEGDEPPPAEERICGTRGVAPCNDGEYCDFPESASCGATDQPGVCRFIPTVCTAEVRPVCGCDGETYTNRCSANSRGVSVASDGACATEPVACVVGGCSSQVCTEDTGSPIITTCEFRPEYACLRESRCERQEDGACGWTATVEYQMCIDGL
jgi:hypothetical protein